MNISRRTKSMNAVIKFNWFYIVVPPLQGFLPLKFVPMFIVCNLNDTGVPLDYLLSHHPLRHHHEG